MGGERGGTPSINTLLDFCEYILIVCALGDYIWSDV